MVPAMAPDVGGAQLQLLLQLFAQLLGGRLQQVLLFGELATEKKRQGAACQQEAAQEARTAHVAS